MPRMKVIGVLPSRPFPFADKIEFAIKLHQVGRSGFPRIGLCGRRRVLVVRDAVDRAKLYLPAAKGAVGIKRAAVHEVPALDRTSVELAHLTSPGALAGLAGGKGSASPLVHSRRVSQREELWNLSGILAQSQCESGRGFRTIA